MICYNETVRIQVPEGQVLALTHFLRERGYTISKLDFLPGNPDNLGYFTAVASRSRFLDKLPEEDPK